MMCPSSSLKTDLVQDNLCSQVLILTRMISRSQKIQIFFLHDVKSCRNDLACRIRYGARLLLLSCTHKMKKCLQD